MEKKSKILHLEFIQVVTTTDKTSRNKYQYLSLRCDCRQSSTDLDPTNTHVESCIVTLL